MIELPTERPFAAAAERSRGALGGLGERLAAGGAPGAGEPLVGALGAHGAGDGRGEEGRGHGEAGAKALGE